MISNGTKNTKKDLYVLQDCLVETMYKGIGKWNLLWKNRIVKSTPMQQLLMNIVHVAIEISESENF